MNNTKQVKAKGIGTPVIIAIIIIVIAIAGLGGYLVLKGVGEAPPAEFEVSKLIIWPPGIEPGESVSIEAMFKDVEDLEGTFTVELKIDGVVERTSSITFDGEGPRGISYLVQREVPKTYSVEVGGLSGAFVVLTPRSGAYLHETGETVLNHGKLVYSFCWSPDGTKIASAGANIIRIWDAATGHCIKSITEDGCIRDIAWSPDGTMLAYYYRVNAPNRPIKILDASSWELLTFIENGHSQYLGGLSWSPDSTWIVSCYELLREHEVGLKIWNARRGYSLKTLSLGDVQQIYPTWSPTLAAEIASVPSGYLAPFTKILIWDVDTGEYKTLRGHKNRILALAWSPDGDRLASSSADNTIRIWNVRNGSSRVPVENMPYVHSLDWSPDGTKIVTSHLEVWDVDSGHRIEVRPYGWYSFNSQVSWSPDGVKIAADWENFILIRKSPT